MKVKAFGSWNLPYALGEDKRVTASLAGARTILGAAGYWDDLGDLVVLRPGLVEVKMAFYDEDSWGDLDDVIDEAKFNLFKERAKLKIAMNDGDEDPSREALARCLSFSEVWRYDQPRLVVCSATFELLQPHWDWLWGDNIRTSTSGSFDLDNIASTCQTDRTVRVRIHGLLNTIYTLTNTTLGMSLTYDGSGGGSIANGTYVEIDCGAMTVKTEGGADRWQYVTLGNTQIGFMALAPGVLNAFTQSPTIQVQIYWRRSFL